MSYTIEDSLRAVTEQYRRYAPFTLEDLEAGRTPELRTLTPVPESPRHPRARDVECEVCGEVFMAIRKNRRICSARCRNVRYERKRAAA